VSVVLLSLCTLRCSHGVGQRGWRCGSCCSTVGSVWMWCVYTPDCLLTPSSIEF
ncbi:unnamed protein product, partial [Candidula unifasciata]